MMYYVMWYTLIDAILHILYNVSPTSIQLEKEVAGAWPRVAVGRQKWVVRSLPGSEGGLTAQGQRPCFP